MKKKMIVILLNFLYLMAMVGWILILALMVDVSILCAGLFGLYWPLGRLMRKLEKKYWRYWV